MLARAQRGRLALSNAISSSGQPAGATNDPETQAGEDLAPRSSNQATSKHCSWPRPHAGARRRRPRRNPELGRRFAMDISEFTAPRQMLAAATGDIAPPGHAETLDDAQ